MKIVRRYRRNSFGRCWTDTTYIRIGGVWRRYAVTTQTGLVKRYWPKGLS